MDIKAQLQIQKMYGMKKESRYGGEDSAKTDKRGRKRSVEAETNRPAEPTIPSAFEPETQSEAEAE
jgi:hypothetical protein